MKRKMALLMFPLLSETLDRCLDSDHLLSLFSTADRTQIQASRKQCLMLNVFVGAVS